MLFHVGIENHNEGPRSIAWALEHPGCYAYGKDADSALAAMPAAIRAYANWINQHEPAWLRTQNIDINVDDVWNNYFVNDKFERATASENAYAVEAWFQYDWRPLSGEEIERALKLLAWSRADLLKAIDGLSAEKLDQAYPNEKWTINGILRHIGGGEGWGIERLQPALPPSKKAQTPMERLAKNRQAVLGLLSQIARGQQMVGPETG